MTVIRADNLTLHALTDPSLGSFTIEPGRTSIIGRAAESAVCLLHNTVSTRHAEVFARGIVWFVTDLASTTGTYLNGVKLDAAQPAAVHAGDLVRIGPWAFRVGIGAPSSRISATIDDRASGVFRVERLSKADLPADRRLDLLIECAARFHGAPTESSLAEAAAELSCAGTGFARAAVLRGGVSDDVEVLAIFPAGQDTSSVSFSRSLIREAMQGQLARLSADAAAVTPLSIVQQQVHSAMCAPVRVGGAAACLLYLDARGQEHHVRDDAAGFLEAVARMHGLALASLKRGDLEQRQQRLMAEIAAAREVQQHLMPTDEGVLGPVKYAVRMEPGALVAGDLFDVIPLSDGRVGVTLGDVTGQGVGSAVLMATTQAYLHGALQMTGDPAEAVSRVNRYIASHSPLNRFVSLWVGVFDPAHELVYVDAGHGHWAFRAAGGRPEPAPRAGGIPIGIDPDYEFTATRIPVTSGDRVTVYSDGVVEQRGRTGVYFGLEGLLKNITPPSTPQEEVTRVFDAVKRFAGTELLDDDATVASVEVM